MLRRRKDETHREARARAKHNGWRLQETISVKGGIRLNVVRADGRPFTLRCRP